MKLHRFQKPGSAHILRDFHRYPWNTLLKTIDEERQVIPCLAGRSQLVVRGDGQVAGCELLPGVDSIREHSLGEIIA